MADKYSLADVRAMEEDTITPKIAADVLGCTGFLLGKMCQKEPQKVPFPFICIGNKTIIPRLGFIRWMENRQADNYYVSAMKVEPGDRFLIPASSEPLVKL